MLNMRRLLIKKKQIEKNLMIEISYFTTISIASMQTGLAGLIEILPRTFLYQLLAHINKAHLIASIGLANILIRSFLQGIQIGISHGLQTLVAQAFGAIDLNNRSILRNVEKNNLLNNQLLENKFLYSDF